MFRIFFTLPIIDVNPVRPNIVGGSLGDIDCRIPNVKGINWKTYRDEDKVTWAHEGTHAINSGIRRDNKSPYGFYLLNGSGVVLSASDFKMSDLAKEIPVEKRGSLYNLYIRDAQKYWNDQPLYCIDELNAYINGAIVGVEYQMDRRVKESLDRAKIMYEYAVIAQEMSRKLNYKDQDILDNLMLEFKSRITCLERVKND